MGLEFPHLGARSIRSNSTVSGYTRLDELYEEKDSVSWYWRVIGLASSWMILAGYLILPSTYYKPENPDTTYRFNNAVLTTVIVALLTAGYSLTALLWFAVHSWLFQAEVIFLPSLAASTVGLLSLAYAFVSSPSYKLLPAAIVHIVLALTAITVFGTLLATTNRRISRVRRLTKAARHAIPPSAPSPGYWSESEQQEPSGTTTYQKYYIANHFPQARPWVHAQNELTRSGSYSSNYPTSSTSYNPIVNEDDAVNQQMAALLANRTTPEGNSSTTYQLQWPVDGEDEPSSPAAHRRPGTRGGSGIREFYGAGGREDRRRGSTSVGNAGGSPPLRSSEGSIWSRISGRHHSTTTPTNNGSGPNRTTTTGPTASGGAAAASAPGTTRGRSESRLAAGSHQRGKSREERRREIELGTITSAV